VSELPAGWGPWGKVFQPRVLALRYELGRLHSLAGCRRLFSACVLRTASVSISRSSALVFGGSRLGGCHWVMDSMWGCDRKN
jgi:hypothetical protein